MKIRVHFEDTDYFGVVHHSKYLFFMERARTEWLRARGLLLNELAQRDIMFVVHSAHLDFSKPARLNDELFIKTTVNNIRGASMTFLQCVYCHDELICQGIIKLVCVDKQLKPRRIKPVIEPVSKEN